MELEWAAFLARVVEPDEGSCLPVEGSEKAVARADVNEIPRDRGGRKDSTPGVEGRGRNRFRHVGNGVRVIAPTGKARTIRDEGRQEDA